MTALLHYYLMESAKRYDHPVIGVLYGREALSLASLYTMRLGATRATLVESRPLKPFDQDWYSVWHRAHLGCLESLSEFIYWELEDPDASLSRVVRLINKFLSYPRYSVPLGAFESVYPAWQSTLSTAQKKALLQTVYEQHIRHAKARPVKSRGSRSR